MTSLRQIAKLAGVSAMTVSRVLRGVPSVDPELRQRVMDITELYHYRPAHLATAPQGSKTFGCIVPRINSPHFSRILKGVMEVA
ncbi:MAG TPA: LacI family DNA-binding transcriptional regulator, partial [Armatimonadota bacterium]